MFIIRKNKLELYKGKNVFDNITFKYEDSTTIIEDNLDDEIISIHNDNAITHFNYIEYKDIPIVIKFLKKIKKKNKNLCTRKEFLDLFGIKVYKKIDRKEIKSTEKTNVSSIINIINELKFHTENMKLDLLNLDYELVKSGLQFCKDQIKNIEDELKNVK